MKRLQLEACGQLRAFESPCPQPEPHEMLLKVSHCALCRTDAKMWREGHRDLIFPRVPGHEICGVDVKSGDRFVVWPGKACGACPHCLGGAENLCPQMRILGFHKDGGLAEWVSVPRSSLIPLPDHLPNHLACLAEPLACTLNALDQVSVRAGESILIFGAGPVGLMAALAAQSRGASSVVLETNPKKLLRSEEFRRKIEVDGATDCRVTAFDAAINAAPSLQALVDGISRLKSGGRFCLFSGFSGGETLPASLINEIHYRQLHVVGAYGCTRRQMENALQILSDQAENVTLLIEDFISLEEVPSALPAILAGETLKFVVEI